MTVRERRSTKAEVIVAPYSRFPSAKGNTGTLAAATDRNDALFMAVNGSWVCIGTYKTDPLTGAATGLVGADGNKLRFDIFTQLGAGVLLYDGVMAGGGSNVLTSATASFTSADVGKALVICSQETNTTTGVARSLNAAGTIVSVNSPTSITVSFTTGSAISGALVAYGVDVGPSLNAALSSLSSSGGGNLSLPNGVFVSSVAINVPNGCSLSGYSNTPQAFGSGASIMLMGYSGTCLFLAAPSVLTGAFIKLGASATERNAAALYDLNVDCMMRCQDAVNSTGSWASNIDTCTLMGGTRYALQMGPSCTVRASYLAGFGRDNVIAVTSGDNRIIDNYIWGQSFGKSGIYCQSDNVQIIGNHFFRGDYPYVDAAAYSISLYYSNLGLIKGGVTISGNSFDHSGGSHIRVHLDTSTNLRGVSIVGNHGFQNDNTANNTYSFLLLDIGTGCDLRGLTVTGNHARASWNGTTGGTLKYFADSTGSTGTITGSTFVGNVANDLVNGFFGTIIPNYTAGNVGITSAGVATVY